MAGRFGIRSLRKKFPPEDACLAYLFKRRHEKNCSCGGRFARMKTRRQFHCTTCRFQVAPTAGTIFEKSKVPLTLWFHALLVFSNAKFGISARVIERDLEVTYKCTWRMLKLIRGALMQSDDVLRGNVEVNTGYFGGKGVAGKNNERLGAVLKQKSVMFAAVQRKKATRAEVAKDATAKANHSKGEYVQGDIHINSTENFWSHVKSSIRGTHKKVSPKYLQSYLNDFVFHANNRGSDRERFFALLDTVLRHREHA